MKTAALLGLAACIGFAAPGHAYGVFERYDFIVEESASGRGVKVAIRSKLSPGEVCGLRVEYGDGFAEDWVLPHGKSLESSHTYAQDGHYQIKVEGRIVPRRGYPAATDCDVGRWTRTVVVPRTAAWNDLIILYHRSNPLFETVATIDGGRRFAKREELVRELAQKGYSYCSLSQTALWSAIGVGSEDNISPETVVVPRLKQAVSAWLGVDVGEGRRLANCWSVGEDSSLKMKPYGGKRALPGGRETTEVPLFILVQGSVAPVVADGFGRTPAWGTGWGNAAYAPIGATIPFADLQRGVAEERQRVAQRAAAAAAHKQRLGELAARDDREHVASVTLAYPQANELKFCTTRHTGADEAALRGYALRGVEPLSDPLRRQLADADIRANSAGRAFRKTYADIDELYAALQRTGGADDCHVFVDLPRNVHRLAAAIERDAPSRRLELNALLPAPELRDGAARKDGYSDWAQREFAAGIGADARGVEQLARRGITTREAFDAAVTAMQAARYPSRRGVEDVVAYVDDSKAAVKARTTALAVRQERERTASAAAAQRSAEYATEFPFTAYLNCGFNGAQLVVMACMQGRGVNSDLELRNGSEYRFLKGYQLRDAYRETQQGLTIPLRRNFSLKTQNVDESLVMTLRIVETATGRVIYERSASQYGVLQASN